MFARSRMFGPFAFPPARLPANSAPLRRGFLFRLVLRRRQSLAICFQSAPPILSGLPFAGFVHGAGFQHCGCDLPVTIHPVLNFRFAHPVGAANSFGHCSGKRFNIR